MSRCIREIMNCELLVVVPETPVEAIRELFRTFAISAVPVVDDGRHPIGMVTAEAVRDDAGTAGARMTTPAICVEGSTSVSDAGRRLALADGHHLVVVDGAGVAVGIVSVLDILRALVGIPAHHPAAFPHWDARTRSPWTDEWPLDDGHAAASPDAAGVIVLVRGLVGETDAIVWVEACANVRDRLTAMTCPAPSVEPELARLLERHALRFRAAVVHREGDRARMAWGLQSSLEHRPPPGAT
jgi:hypothetical protein